MIKEIEDIRRTARERAKRRWNNLRIEREYKASKKEAIEQATIEPKVTYVADVLERDKPDKRGSVIRSQTKFAKYITEMMEGHTKRNKEKYLLLIAIRKRKLRIAKIKLLQAMEAQQSKPPPLQKKDLFG
jgi:hypothetical protein